MNLTALLCVGVTTIISVSLLLSIAGDCDCSCGTTDTGGTTDSDAGGTTAAGVDERGE